MKITIDARMFYHSGVGVYLRHMLDEIISQSTHQFQLIGTPSMLEKLESDLVTIIPSSAPIYSLQEQFELPKIIPTCDIFWSPHLNIPLLPIKAAKRVVTVHDMFHMAYFNKLTLPQKLYTKLIFNRLTKISDGIISVSNASACDIQKYTGYDANNILVIYNSINKKLFQRSVSIEDKQHLADHYQLSDPYLLFVGNLKPHKNVMGIVDAYATIEPFIKEKLVLVGALDGHRTRCSELPKTIKNLGLEKRITVISKVDFEDLPKLYSNARLFLFPTFFEGFGIPPLEAMSCGTPTLISNIPPVQEVCGDAGYTINPKSKHEIASGILTLLKNRDLRKEFIAKGFERVKKYSWHESGKKLLDFFEEIVS